MAYDPWIKVHSEIEFEKLHALGVISFRWNACEFGLKMLFAQAAQIPTALALSITQDMGSVTICNRIRDAANMLLHPASAVEAMLYATDLFEANRINRNQLTHYLPAAKAGTFELRRNKTLGGVMGEPVPSTIQDIRRVAEDILDLRTYLAHLCNHLNKQSERYPLPSRLPLPEKLLKLPPQAQPKQQRPRTPSGE